jgi:hypothetical protein
MEPESKLVKCSQCGEEHDLIDMEVAFGMPDDYFNLNDEDREARGKITNDFCQLDERYFVRSVIPVPVIGWTEIYCWGVWVELSKDDFFNAYDTWKDDDVSHIPKLRGKLANDLPEYENAILMEGKIELKNDSRPFFYVSEELELKSDQTHAAGRGRAAPLMRSVSCKKDKWT